MSYLMGIDLGTSSVKTVIFHTSGTVISSSSRGYDIIIPEQGWAEQNAEALWHAASETIRKAILKSEIDPCLIAGIGFSGQMHGLVPLDKNLKPIRNVIIWMDQRSEQEVAQIESLDMREIVLNPASTGFYGASLLWLKHHEPDTYDKIYKAVLPKDYIRFKICGSIGTDITDAAGTILFDISKEEWSWEMIRKLEIRHDILPSAAAPYEVAGQVTKPCRQKTGLSLRTKVVFGGGDQAMHSIGNGIIKPGILSTNIGTAGQVSCAVDYPAFDPQFRTNTFCHPEKGLWSLVGATLNGGIALKWLRENILAPSSYTDVNNKVSSVSPGSSGLIFLPYLCGERSPHMNPKARGMFFGLTLGMNDTHMLRSVMEGVVFSLKDCLEIFYHLGIVCDKIIASGGGAKSSIWLQIQADILEKEIHTTTIEEEACLGAAIMAGLGTGIYSSLEEACQLLIRKSGQIYQPDPDTQETYRENYETYKSLYQNNSFLFQ